MKWRAHNFHQNGLFILFFLCTRLLCIAAESPLPAYPKIQFVNFSPTVSSVDSSSCIIPFTRAGNLILVKAKADEVEGNFILDTGAPYLVLNITYFRDYPTTGTNTDQTSISGSGSAVEKTNISNF